MRFKIFGKTASMTLLGEVDGEWKVLYATPLGKNNFQFAFDSEKPVTDRYVMPEPHWEPKPAPVLHDKPEAKAKKKTEDKSD